MVVCRNVGGVMGGLPNEERRLAVYVGEMRECMRWLEATVIPKPEFMLLAESNGSGACVQTTL